MTMRTLIEMIFGIYTPVTTDVFDAAGGYVGTTVASGAAGVDWTYIGGVVLFGIVLWSFFRLLGVVIRHG